MRHLKYSNRTQETGKQLSLTLTIFILDPQASLISPYSTVKSNSFSQLASKIIQQQGKKWILIVFSNKSQGQKMSF